MNRLILRAFVFAFLYAINPVFSQTDTTTLVITMKGIKSTKAYWGNYFSGRYYFVDSCQVDTLSGKMSFIQTNIQKGLYFVSVKEGKLFDFVLDQPGKRYVFKGNMAHQDSLRVENSPENKAYLTFEAKRRAKLATIQKQQDWYDMLRRATNDPKAIKDMENKINRQRLGLDSIAEQQIKKYPTHWYSKMLAASRVPKPPKNLNPTVQGRLSAGYLAWVRRHYWDNTDLRDSTLLRSDVWPRFFNEFFVRWVHPIPDSATADIDRLLAKAPKNGALYRYIVLELTKGYEMSERPGADRMFVHMVDRYQRKNETPWLDFVTLENLSAKAELFRPNLTGNPAPPLNGLLDDGNNPVSLQSIEAPFLLLIFYSPLCHHCMDVMPDVYKTWQKFAPKGLKALAVSSDDQYPYWKNFIEKQQWDWIDAADPSRKTEFIAPFLAYNLPVLYLLDKDKKIVWKRLPIEQLEETLGKVFK